MRKSVCAIAHRWVRVVSLIVAIAMTLVATCFALTGGIASFGSESVPEFTGPVSTADGTTTLNSFSAQWSDGSGFSVISNVPER